MLFYFFASPFSGLRSKDKRKTLPAPPSVSPFGSFFQDFFFFHQNALTFVS
jgi:hypothetical protein